MLLFSAAAALTTLLQEIEVCTTTGWGDGQHPSTRMCLEFLADNDVTGKAVLDYGCGSGILSIAAMKLGADRCVAVDIDDEILQAASANFANNGVKVDLVHGRSVVPGDESFDYVLANILVGQLSRSSMVATLALAVKDDGLLCLSGIRPRDVDVLKEVYSPHFSFEKMPQVVKDDSLGRSWARLDAKKKPRDQSAPLFFSEDAAA